MEKKLLAILFVIGMIIYAFIQALPFILGFGLLAGLVYGTIRLYWHYPNEYAKWGARILEPLLFAGWIYIGYLAYTNIYCNTYYIESYMSDGMSAPKYKVIAKNDREAVIKSWDEYIERYKPQIDAVQTSYHDFGKLRICNHTNDEIVRFYQLDVFDSLSYNNGKVTFKLDDFFLPY